jgi:ubiquinone/menaquinone biosynthesis C-methylase UbiE
VRQVDGYVRQTQDFFADRAAAWDRKYGDDLPAYEAAVAEAGIAPGSVAVDVGCGTGRALPALRTAVGSHGAVLAVDVTPAMLAQVRLAGRATGVLLALADARRLPLRDAAAGAVFAAGLVQHLPDPVAGLAELARITRPGGRLVLFHPSGRAALAARHGETVRDDAPLSPGPLRAACARTGWTLDRYDDAVSRFLALATRTERIAAQ